MKYFKCLIMLLAVSVITSLSGIKANPLDPYYFVSTAPPFNGSVSTNTRTKDEFSTQELRYTYSQRDLDVVLQDEHGNNMSDWFLLRTGWDVIFDNVSAMLEDQDYKIFVDSRINYFTYTDFNFKWWVH